MRGHGRSAGPRVSSPSIDAYLDDLDRVMAVVRAAEPGRPVFLLGHSLGGLIATLYALERDPALAGLLCCRRRPWRFRRRPSRPR
jgi:acylglycerol lipase